MSCLLFNIAIEPLAAALRASTIRGFALPGATERLVAKLFADDTTVFLSKDDEYGTMTAIAKTWCDSSRAKFNLSKTEAIPVGSKEFRATVLRERKMREDGGKIPEDVHIAQDGESVRILGAWLGNVTDRAAPWKRVTDTIRKNLRKWGTKNISLNGKRLVVGMEVGGRTQFLAKAIGMPQEVEKELECIVRTFLWGEGKKPMVARELLCGPFAEGGLKLLDIRARNEAVELMWLRDYLNLTRWRATWTILADALLARAVAATHKRTDRAARVNTFLQTWTVSTRAAAGLPSPLRRMVRVAERYGVVFHAPNPDLELVELMPIWYH
ncbi:hypothetical protein GY45DRAFT_1249032, partial [Cubamyces sp. BRFM 1775]